MWPNDERMGNTLRAGQQVICACDSKHLTQVSNATEWRDREGYRMESMKGNDWPSTVGSKMRLVNLSFDVKQSKGCSRLILFSNLKSKLLISHELIIMRSHSGTYSLLHQNEIQAQLAIFSAQMRQRDWKQNFMNEAEKPNIVIGMY